MYYVIRVKTGKEDKTIEDIKKGVDGRLIFDAFSPRRTSLRKYKGNWVEYQERCFPGYIFVETDNIKDLFVELSHVEDYTRILGREGHKDHFVPLNEDESRMIDILYNAETGRTTPLSDVTFAEGDKVLIVDGPLRGIQSTIKKVDLHKRTVVVAFQLFHQTVEVKMGINIITKVTRK